MKKIFFFTLIISNLTITAKAENIEHLFYKPAKSDFVFDTSYNIIENDQKNSGVVYFIEEAEVREIISYGINNKLTIDFDLAFREIRKTYNESTTNEYDGLTNPEITARYRIFNQTDNNKFLDLNISYAPDIFDRKEANTIIDGSVASGGNIYNMSIDYGKNTQNFTYKLNLGMAYHEDSTTTEPDGSSSITDSKTDIELGAIIQYPLNDVISTSANISQSFIGNTAVNDIPQSGGDAFTIGLGANFTIDPKKSMIRVYIAKVKKDDLTSNGIATITERDTNTYGISYKYIYSKNNRKEE